MEPYDATVSETPTATPAKLTIGVILGRLLISALSWTIHCLVTFMLMVVFVGLIPKARDYFEAMELDLPAVSELMIVWSNGFVNYWYLLVLAHLLIDAPIAVAVCYLPSRYQWVTWVWFSGYLILAILMLTMACSGLVIPYIDMTTNLS